MFSVDRNPSRAVLRSFGYAMLGGFSVLGALLWYRGLLESGWVPASGWGWHGTPPHKVAVVFWALGVLLFLTSFLPALGRPVYVAWMSAAMFMGMIATTVGLTILFVAFLPFFSLIRFSDPLRLKLRAHGSYWEDHKTHEATLERCERPF